jgi:hypothetical protein
MRKAQKDPQGWLTGVVRNIMERPQICGLCKESPPPIPREIYRRVGKTIERILSGMTPAVRGEIADLGLPDGNYTPAVNLPCASYVNRGDSGKNIIMKVATVTIVARMYELLREEHARREKEKRADWTDRSPDTHQPASINLFAGFHGSDE